MTKEEVLDMAEKVYGKCDWHESALAHLEQFAKLVAEHERESCAKICEEEQGYKTAFCALKIRARGDKND